MTDSLKFCQKCSVFIQDCSSELKLRLIRKGESHRTFFFSARGILDQYNSSTHLFKACINPGIKLGYLEKGIECISFRQSFLKILS